MDDKLKKALESANFMITFNNQMELIKNIFNENCLYHENGRRFSVNRELINFVNTLLSRDIKEDAVIIDDLGAPYQIADVQDFYDKIFSLYYENVNRYYIDYNDLIKKRSVTKIIEE